MAIWWWNGVLRLHYPMTIHAILQPITAETVALCICDRARKCNGGHYTHTHVCICIYKYMCVCVCVCVLLHESFCVRSAIKNPLDTTTTGACYSSYMLELGRSSSG